MDDRVNAKLIIVVTRPSKLPAIDAILSGGSKDSGFDPSVIAHDQPAIERLANADILIVECRLIQAFEDLEIIKSVRLMRPYLPIIAASCNTNEEFRLAAFAAGANDYISTDCSIDQFNARLTAHYRTGSATRIVEIQNQELAAEVERRKAAEAEQIKTQALLVQSVKMASLGEMAGGIAHEINNPLTIINGKISQLRHYVAQKPVPEDLLAKALDSVEATVLRIAKIVKGLRTFSRSGAKDPFETVSVAALLDDVVSFCAEKLARLNITFRVPTIPPGLQVECRATQISQVILNLINNARDAVETCEKKWIELQVADLGTAIEIAVVDAGSGIPSNIQTSLFQPFFTTKPVNKGTGLGLSISKGIIEDHSGKLFVDNAAAHTRLVVVLPKRQSSPSTKTKVA